MKQILKSHMKSLFSRPLLSILLILGMVVSSFSLVLYYAASSKMIQLLANGYGIERSIEGEMKVFHLSDITEIIEGEDFPKVSYVSLVSHEFQNYDLIGIDYIEKGNEIERMDSGGEFITQKHSGKYVAVVSEDIASPSMKVGDIVKVKTNKFEVIGILPSGGYLPETYDIRRISEDNVAFSGVDMTDKVDLSGRPNKVVILPINVFCNTTIESTPHIRIVFEQSVTEVEISKAEEKLAQYIDIMDISDYIEVSRIGKNSNLIGYMVVVIAGIINIVSLYSLYISDNKKAYDTYYMFGASRGKILLIMLTEVLFLTVGTFLLGYVGAMLFLTNTNIVEAYIPITILDMLILISSIYIIELLFALPVILRQLGISQKNRIEHAKSTALRSKMLYHFANELTGKNLVGILSIAVVSFVVSYSLTFSLTYLYEGSRYKRFYDQFEYSINMPALTMDIHSFQYEYENEKLYSVYEDSISFASQLNGVEGVGKTYTVWLADTDGGQYIDNSGLTDFMIVNKDFCRFSPIPLSSGSWEALLNYDPYSEEPIPVIIPWQYRDIYPTNEPFSMRVEDYDNKDISNNQWYEKTFIVVGVTKNDALRFAMNQTPCVAQRQVPEQFFRNQVDAYKVSQLTDATISDVNVIYAPEFLAEDEFIKPFRGVAYYLYTSKDNVKSMLEQWNISYRDFGGIINFDTLIENDINNFNSGGGSMFWMHFSVASILLIFCVGSYTLINGERQKRKRAIYKLCGMTNGTAALMDNIKNAVSMFIPAVIGIVFGLISASAIRSIDNYTIIAVLFSCTAVNAILFLITSVVERIVLNNSNIRVKEIR